MKDQTAAAANRKPYDSDLTDAQWSVLDPLLPTPFAPKSADMGGRRIRGETVGAGERGAGLRVGNREARIRLAMICLTLRRLPT